MHARYVVALLFVVALGTSAVSAQSALPVATRSLDLRAEGLQSIPASKRLSEDVHFTVDYLDSTHLLVTYVKPGLVKRRPECPQSHSDRVISAVIYETSSGKAVRRAEWYVHDRKPYLWPLHEGRFLLRVGNQLFKLDRDLKQKLLLDSPKELLWVNVTPDGKQIATETEQGADSAKAETTAKKGQKEKGKYQIQLLDADSLQVQRTVEAKSLLHFKALSSGYVDLTSNMAREVWMVRFGPDAKQKAAITRVRTRCVPDIAHPSGNTILVGRCSWDGKGYSMTALTVAGQRLWHVRWPEERNRLAIASSESGERFAYSALRRPAAWRPPTQAELKGAVDHAPEQWEQVIEVLETAGGHHVFKASASRPFFEYNFALSPAGDSIAILNDTTLDIYPLSPVPQEEQVKFAAIQADVPDLYLLPDEQELAAAAQAAGEDPDAELAIPPVATGGAATASAPPPTAAVNGAAPAPATPVAAASTDNAPVLTIKSSSVNVGVDVVVTDSKGSPIRGLKNGDFVVTEDGTPQRIRFMDELDFDAKTSDTKVSEGKAGTPDAKRSPNVFSNLARPEVKTVTVIVYDVLNTPPSAQAFSRQQLLKYLKNKPPDMRVAIFALSNGLRMISGFTDEEDALIATITGKGGKNGKKGGLPVSAGLFSRTISQNASNFDQSPSLPPGMEAAMDQVRESSAVLEAANTDFRVNSTLYAFAQLARYLSGLPGRKNVIWLSGSFPLNIDPSLALNRNNSVSMRNYVDQVKQMTNMLAKAHVAVYPVDVRGLQVYDQNVSYSNPGAQVSTPGGGGSLRGRDPNSNETGDLLAGQDMSVLNQMATSLAENGAMNLIASQTGGKAFYNTNDIGGAIQQSVSQASHYYMLSYSPANRNFDGKFRKIHVNVGDKKYRLSYRNGYFAEDPDAPIRTDMATEFAAGAMQHGSPESHQLPFLVRVAPEGEPRNVTVPDPTPEKKGKKGKSTGLTTTKVEHLGIDYLVPAKDLRFTVSPEGRYRGNFNFMIAAYGPDGDAIARLGGQSTMDLKPEEYTKLLTTGLRMHQEVDIPVNAISLRLGIQDAFTASLGTTEIPLPVPPLPGPPKRRGKPMPEIETD